MAEGLAGRCPRSAREGQALLDDLIDPAIAKKSKREERLEASRLTFELVAREWFDTNKGRWALVHQKDVICSLERDVFGAIGNIPITQLTPPLVLAVLRAIEARGAIETARRVRQRISEVFIYAIAQGITASDPAEKLGAVLKQLCKGRQPAITDLVLLRKMIHDAEADRRARSPVLRCVCPR